MKLIQISVYFKTLNNGGLCFWEIRYRISENTELCICKLQVVVVAITGTM